MKIIKRGRNLDAIRIRCDKCGCVFEFNKSEAEVVEVSKRIEKIIRDEHSEFFDYMGSYNVPAIEYHINCPCCGMECKSEKFEIEKDK